jgi:hypothetical protein
VDGKRLAGLAAALWLLGARLRRAANERAERELTPADKEALERSLVGRVLPSGHARLPWTYKIYLGFKTSPRG